MRNKALRRKFSISHKVFLPIAYISFAVIAVIVFVSGLSDLFFLPSIIIANIIVIFNCVRAQRRTRYGTFASLSALAPLFFYLCHFLYQTAFQLGFVEYNEYVIFNFHLYREATVLALAGLFALMAGIYFSEWLYSNSIRIPCKKDQSYDDVKFHKVAVISSIIFFLILLGEIFRIGFADFAASGYARSELTEKFSRILTNAQRFFMYSIFAAFASLPRKKWKRGIILPGILALLFFMLLSVYGYRGHIGVFLLTCYCVFAIRIHPLPLKILTVFFTAMIISWSVILAGRSIAISERDYSSIISRATTTDSIIDTAVRTPGMMITMVTRTINLYPHIFPYLWGKSYLNGIYFLIPNLSLEKKRSSTLYRFDLAMSAYYFGSVFRSIRGVGMGATPLAEAYANFGILGLSLLFLGGWFVGRTELISVSSGNCLLLAFLGISSYTILWSMRNDFLTLPRGIIYGYLFLKLLSFSAACCSNIRVRTTQVSRKIVAQRDYS
ncbi:MAG: O-antigen polysaccharide polymerase Wzy [bacterium]